MLTTRVQRSRAKGYRAPEGSVYVGRPSVFGNPFGLDRHTPAEAVRLYGEWLVGREDLQGDAKLQQRRRALLLVLPGLRGKTLTCWCPVGQPCHADYLCQLLNRGEPIV